MNPNTKVVTLEVYSSDSHDMRARYIMSRNLAICIDIFNRSTLTNGMKDVHFENKGLICKQFQNFKGLTLVVNGKYACQEHEDFDLLHNNEWIDTACTMYSTKLFKQIQSIDELHFLRGIQLIDNDKYVQVEVDGKVVVVEQGAFGKHEQHFGHILKQKYGNFFQDGVINKYLKVLTKKK